MSEREGRGVSGGNFTIKRRVWFGLTASVIGIGAWAWWAWSRQVPLSGAASAGQPFVQLVGAGMASESRILQERAELMDPTPLFFPTQWNYGQRPLSEGRMRQPGQVFGSFEPKLTVADQGLALYGAEAAPVPEKLSDVLVQGNEAPFAGMGQVDGRLVTLPVRAGYLEVRRVGDTVSVIEQSLTGIQLPRTDFAPVEFMVVIGTGGLVGSPILLSSSGWDEVDEYFRSYLARAYPLGERLSPGRYRVLVGT